MCFFFIFIRVQGMLLQMNIMVINCTFYSELKVWNCVTFGCLPYLFHVPSAHRTWWRSSKVRKSFKSNPDKQLLRRHTLALLLSTIWRSILRLIDVCWYDDLARSWFWALSGEVCLTLRVKGLGSTALKIWIIS